MGYHYSTDILANFNMNLIFMQHYKICMFINVSYIIQSDIAEINCNNVSINCNNVSYNSI